MGISFVLFRCIIIMEIHHELQISTIEITKNVVCVISSDFEITAFLAQTFDIFFLYKLNKLFDMKTAMKYNTMYFIHRIEIGSTFSKLLIGSCIMYELRIRNIRKQTTLRDAHKINFMNGVINGLWLYANNKQIIVIAPHYENA